MSRNSIKPRMFLAAFALAASTAAVASGTNDLSVTAGAEIRLRADVTEHLPNAKRGEADDSSYARIRIRPWIRTTFADYGIFLRLSDEFRHYNRPKSNSSKQRWPNVLFIDNLHFTANSLFDGALDLKVGRQDMAFGAKRILSDGVGGDGSRAAYFDALRLTWHADEARTLDAFALYQAKKDWMPTLGKEHENGKEPHAYDTTGYEQDEFGAGLYWQDRAHKDFGYDAYYVAKREIRNRDSKYRSEGGHADTHTFGVRLLPHFTETLSGEVELAGQAGSQELFAGQAYGGLTYAPQADCKPKFTGACWILSGDDEGGRGQHAWHAVFNRETGLGESIAPMYEKYNYTNLIYPHLAFGCNVASFSSVTFQTGPMYTAVQEDDAGRFRGLYAQIKYTVSPAKFLGVDLLHGGTFALQGEYFGKGDYFKDGSDHDALFARAELAWDF